MTGEESRMDPIQPPSGGAVRCGVDVGSIERIAGLPGEFGDSFRERVYTPAERRYCEAQADPPQHYAARWAVTEAFLKATDADAPSVPLNEIGVRHDGDEPVLVVSPAAMAAAATTIGADGETERVGTVVSLSHDRHADVAAGQVLVFDSGQLDRRGGGAHE
jgi:holo-[acyl-carrier protein] synthase